MTKRTVILIAILIVLIVVGILVGFKLQNTGDNKEAVLSPAPMTEEEMQGTVETGAADLGENPTVAPAPMQTDEAIVIEDLTQFFSDMTEYKGKRVILEGIVYGEAINNQGILSFSMVTDYELQCVMVSELDMEEKISLAAGDKVKIDGIVTEFVQNEDSKGRPVDMPLINAIEVMPATE